MGYPEMPEPDLGMPWRVNAKSDGAAHCSGFTYDQMRVYADTVRAVDAQWHRLDDNTPTNKPILLAIEVSSRGRSYKWQMQVCEIDEDGHVADAITGDSTGWDFDDYQGWRDLPAPPSPEVEK